MSSVTITVNLEPFPVPDSVSVTPETKPPFGKTATGAARRIELNAMRYSLSTLDETTLMALCDEFTDSVFKAAGKNRLDHQELKKHRRYRLRSGLSQS